jgi:short subunit dehydrogenase-like uncharacterized protein
LIESTASLTLLFFLLQTPKMPELMIYGATGYTGRLAGEYAKSIGLDFIIAGRTLSKLQNLASLLEVSYRAFDVQDSSAHFDSSLKDVSVLLNCAGPFHRTAEPLMEACIRNGVHYLDIAAELDSYKLAGKLDEKAKNAKVMLMPGSGGSVTMLGCLAMHVVEQMDSPVSVEIALYVAGSLSRGSAVSAQEGAMTKDDRRQVGEERIQQPAESPKEFDFADGNGRVECIHVILPDLITIEKSTGISSVRTFVHISGNVFPTGDARELPNGPTAEERNANPYHAAVEIVAKDKTVRRAVLHTVNGYTFTSIASIEIAKRVLLGRCVPGFQTPAEVFGSEFVTCIEGTTIEEM